MDITNFMTQFINLIVNFFIWAYKELNNITFSGISLLQYIITILVLGVIVEILFTLVSSRSISSSRSYAISERRKAERSKKNRASKQEN